MRRIKGYFFTLDAFIAIGIIAAGLVLVFMSSSQQPFQEQSVFFAQDLMNGLSQQTIRNTNDPYIQQLRRDGNISSLDSTLLEQMGEFYVTDRLNQSTNLAFSVTQGRVNPQFGYSIAIDSTIIYSNGQPRPTTPVLVVSRSIISGVINQSIFWGPLTAEVQVWQR